MPIYNYRCPTCGATVERVVLNREHADQQRCDKQCATAPETEDLPLLEREEISPTANMAHQWAQK